MKAYILVTTDAGKAVSAGDSIRQIEGVKSADTTIGPYDIIVFAEVADTAVLTNLIVDKIQKVDGVSRTLTCISVS
jgi:DNA-binding Lrp family transcriptional regulator